MDVVLMRHGESEANFENYWTGWLDVSLTEKGQEQARKAGEKIKNAQIEFDAAFTSVLKRASLTCQIILEESDQLWIPTFKTWRLNERHYGALVGKNKDEMAREFGADQVKRWRRDYYEMPPLVSPLRTIGRSRHSSWRKSANDGPAGRAIMARRDRAAVGFG